MKMNPKAAALGAMAEEGGNYKEPSTKAANAEEDTAEGESVDSCCVSCKCGADLLCASCKESVCKCDC